MTADSKGQRPNVVLIGMPASGKSTVGVLLAKALGCGFVDTDILIQSGENLRLDEIIRRRGVDGFRQTEGEWICRLAVDRHVIATGGSAVYCPSAMDHLAASGVVVFLDVPFAELEQRLGDLDARGVLYAPGQNLADLHKERLPLYRRWADITIDGRHPSAGHACSAILHRLHRSFRTSF
jgi:shikimate kinase